MENQSFFSDLRNPTTPLPMVLNPLRGILLQRLVGLRKFRVFSFKSPNFIHERVNCLADEKMILTPFGVIVEGAVVAAIIQVDAHIRH